jgi:hypothetical protein
MVTILLRITNTDITTIMVTDIIADANITLQVSHIS